MIRVYFMCMYNMEKMKKLREIDDLYVHTVVHHIKYNMYTFYDGALA